MTSPTAGDTADQKERLQRALGGGYEVREPIGTGGFATVFEAFDRQLRREVAVKVLRAELEAPVFRERFRREAEAVAQLRHPHVVPIYAVGESEGLAYLVMPRIRGVSLEQRLQREGKLPIGEAVRILRDSASALAAAHRAGIVHRDIKPDNIMLDGEEGNVLLMDFGIAKALGSAEAGITGTGMIIGTPRYMSPEQATGDKTIDHRSDLYSLGLVGFQMVAGALPFTAESVPMLIVKHLTEPAPSLLTVRPECPAGLAETIARCLEKEPAARWASADDLVRALQTDRVFARSPEMGKLAARVSGRITSPAAASPIRSFRNAIVVTVGIVIIGGIVDFVIGMPFALPLAVLIGSFTLAAKYGRLWRDGYSWEDVWAGAKEGSEPRLAEMMMSQLSHTPRSLEMKRLGTYAPAVHRARSIRGAIKTSLANMPRSEHEQLPDLLPTADLLLAESMRLATQLTALDERPVIKSVRDIDQQLIGVRKDPESPARTARLNSLESQRRVQKELEDHRTQLEQRMTQVCEMMERLGAALDRVESEGVASSREELVRAAAEATGLLAGFGGTVQPT